MLSSSELQEEMLRELQKIREAVEPKPAPRARVEWNTEHCPTNCDQHHNHNDDCYCTIKSVNPQ